MTAVSYETFLLYMLIGGFTGILAGLLGVGGGAVIVPALLFHFRAEQFSAAILMHMAVACSLVAIVFTSMSSTLAHHRRGAVLWSTALVLAPGIVLGAVAGGIIVDGLSSDVLRYGFAAFECLVAWRLVRDRQPAAHRTLPGRAGLAGVGAGIGAVSTLMGIGGGALTVPFLLWCNINIRNAIATSAACGLPIALAGSGTLIVAGWGRPDLPQWSSGYVYWPAGLLIATSSVLTAPLGARLAHSLPLKALKRIFAVLLIAVAIRMVML